MYRLSLDGASGTYSSLRWVCGLIVAAFLVAEHGLQGVGASVVEMCGLSSCGTWA